MKQNESEIINLPHGSFMDDEETAETFTPESGKWFTKI